jgi:hypothetical protein
VLASSPIKTSVDARTLTAVGAYMPNVTSMVAAVMGPSPWKAIAGLASSLPSAQIRQK